MHHANGNVIWMVRNVIQAKSGITVNVGFSIKTRYNKMRAKKIIFGILLHVFVKIANI